MSTTSRIPFWEERQFFKPYDLLIVGGGLVGLSAALAGRQYLPHGRIALLERGPLPTGASTRNAGFGCFGSPTELLDDLENMSEDEVWNLVEMRWKGLRLLRQQIGDDGLGLEPLGGYEVFREKDSIALERVRDQLENLNKHFLEITGLPDAFRPANPAWVGRQMAVKQVVSLRLECQLDPARMIRSLWQKIHEQDVEMFHGLSVSDFQFRKGYWEIGTEPNLPFRARKVLVATNGFTRRLLPELEVQPVRNQVLLTEPLPKGFDWEGCFHYDRGYVYFRNVGRRILLGGFRHLDREAESTDQFGTTQKIHQAQLNWLQDVLKVAPDTRITHQWSGILGVGPVKQPIIRELEPGLAVAVRLGGMGIALGSLLGREAVQILLANG